MSRTIFMDALRRRRAARVAVGSATSVACVELMDRVGAHFPLANPH